MRENITHITDSSFEDDVLKAKLPVLVDYWAEWCRPCHAITPILEDIADDYEGRLVIAKMDIDANPKTPQKYAIRAVPTLMIFKDGGVIGTKTGLMAKSQLAAFIDSTV